MPSAEAKKPRQWLEGIFTETRRWPAERQLGSNLVVAMAETLQAVPKGVKTVLDAGCGDGRLAHRMAATMEVTALDFSRAALAQVRTRKLCGDLTHLPFSEAAFDLVLCSQVLEHLPDEMLAPALAELRRVALRYVLVTVPNYEKDEADIRARSLTCPRCGQVFHPDGHVRAFTTRLLRTLFSARGIADTVCVSVRGIAPRRVRRLPRLGALRCYVRPEWWGYWRPGQRCPFCGYESQDLDRSRPLLYGWRQAERFLRFVLCPDGHKEYRWLLALYEVGPRPPRSGGAHRRSGP